MGLSQYISDTFSSIFSKSVLRQVADIKRAYYQRSLYLLFACQSLPEPPLNSGQHQELKDLFRTIERAILSGIKMEDKEKCAEQFNLANLVLEKYATKYSLRFRIDMIKNQPHLPLSFDDACKNDLEAQELFKEVSKKVEEKIEGMKKVKRRQVDIKIWADEPTTYLKEKLQFNSESCPVEIEETATLAILLHRLLEYQMLRQGERKYMLHLDKFPYFYNASPVDLKPFKSKDGSSRRIPCVCPYKSVAEYTRRQASELDRIPSLHVIMDREFTTITVRVGNTEFIELSSKFYRNVWRAEDANTMVVRQRSLSFSLATLDSTPITMPVPSPHQGLYINSSVYHNQSNTTFVQVDSQGPYNTSSVLLNQSTTTLVQAGGPGTAASLHSSMTSTASLTGGPPSTSNVVNSVPLQMPQPQTWQNAALPTNQITVINNIQIPTPVSSPVSNHTSKKHADVSAVPIKESTFSPPINMEPQVLSTYSGNVGFDPTLGNMVDMKLATGEKKKTGFRAWMRNTLGSLAGK